MRKLFLSIIAVVCCMTASADPQNVNGVYQLGSKEDLTWFANYVNSGNNTACAILTSDITMNANVLDSDGRLNSDNTFTAWTPIGGHGVDYKGEFNGNGHTISGLYFNSDSKNNVGIFGKAGGNAYIHDLGIRDSYFYGLDHVGGICGDFASGRIENCWSGATIKAKKWNAGGISGSCYVNASIKDCYNIGKVFTISDNGSYGGICGGVYENTNVDYTISNCYTLKGKCEHEVYGTLDGGCPASKINHSFVKDEDDFASGEVCYKLNHGVTDGSQKWYQTLGGDPLPVMDKNKYCVYYGYEGDVLKYSNSEIYVNATHHEVCAATCNAVGYTRECWEDTKSGKIYAEEACINELNAEDVVLQKLNHKNKQHHDHLEATCLTDGNIEYWHCPDCNTYFTNEACTASTTDYIIAALGHDFTYTPYKTSTCTSEGDVEHWHCNRCEKDFNTGEQMASEDHVISGSLILPCKESDAIVVGMDNGKIYDDCHTFTPPTEEGETTIATVTFNGENVLMKVKNGEITPYSLNETKPLETFFAHTFTLKANQDPNYKENYYSTFFTNEYAYKVPTMAKAYEGDVESGDDADVLKLSSVGGVIPQGEAVILKATDSSIELLPSARRPKASSENDLEGTDKEKTLGANQYALSLGQEGVGFYLWEGKSIGANKAYLTLNASAGAKAFIFQFDDAPTGIEKASPISSPEGKDLMYNLNGVRVNESYKGIVIKNGKKYVVK